MMALEMAFASHIFTRPNINDEQRLQDMRRRGMVEIASMLFWRHRTH